MAIAIMRSRRAVIRLFAAFIISIVLLSPFFGSSSKLDKELTPFSSSSSSSSSSSTDKASNKPTDSSPKPVEVTIEKIDNNAVVDTAASLSDHADQVINVIHESESDREDGRIDPSLISAGHVVPDLPVLSQAAAVSASASAVAPGAAKPTEKPLFADGKIETTTPHEALLLAAQAYISETPRKVFLINSVRYHFEIVLPVLNILSVLPNSNVTLFAARSGYNRFGVKPWLRHYSLNKLRMVDVEKMADHRNDVPDLVFLTSCAEDTNYLGSTLTGYLERGSKVMCIVHEAQRWNLNDEDNNRSAYKNQIRSMIPWIKKKRWDLVTLSTHVQSYVYDNFPTFFQTGSAVEYNSTLFYPVFQLPESRILMEREWPFVAIVGKLEPWRRDYSKIFRQYEEFNPPFNLSLVGSGVPLEVPAAVKDKVRHELDLDFPEYFRTISKAAAVVPSFAQKEYLFSQASSSIATSIITTTPALMTRQMLKAYAYVTEDAAWLQNEGETEIEAISRVSAMGPDVWWQRKERISRLRDELTTKNLAMFGDTLRGLK